MLDLEMSLPELYEDMKKNEALIEYGDIPSVIEMNNGAEFREYIVEKQALTKAGQALDLTLETTLVIDGNSIASLCEKEQNLNNLRNLTNNLDPVFVRQIYQEGFHSKLTDAEAQKKADNAIERLDYLKTKEAFYENYLIITADKGDVTVEALMKSVDNLEALMKKEGIPLDNISATAKQKVYDKLVEEETHIYEKPTEKEREERNKTLETVTVVESSDGYAINSAPDDPALAAKFYEQVKTSSGNEVVHNEAPKVTTNDLSKVGGNVRYEEVKDIGTVEKGQGELNREEKREVEEFRYIEEVSPNSRAEELAYEQRKYEEQQAYIQKQQEEKQEQIIEQSPEERAAAQERLNKMIMGTVATAATITALKGAPEAIVAAGAVKAATNDGNEKTAEPKAKKARSIEERD